MKIVSVVSRLSFIASVWLTVFHKEYWYSMLIFLLVIFLLEVFPYNVPIIPEK
jgi:hypothetical protein